MGRLKKDTGETIEQKQDRLERGFELASKEIHRKEVTFDTNNYVVMANNMILHSASNLTLNEVKILRFFIMQTEKDDDELFRYTVEVPRLAQATEINPKVLYRDLKKMAKHLMQEVIYIGNKSDDKDKWEMFHWVDVCRYEDGVFEIKISDELKPFLVGLRGNFTRYRLSEIVSLNSMYAIRLYEALNGYMKDNNRPSGNRSIEIPISIEELRRITDTTDKFERISNFKSKVIDVALKEINQKSLWLHITATPYKSHKSVVGYYFLIESANNPKFNQANTNQDIKIKNDRGQKNRQMDLSDYEIGKNTFKID